MVTTDHTGQDAKKRLTLIQLYLILPAGLLINPAVAGKKSFQYVQD